MEDSLCNIAAIEDEFEASEKIITSIERWFKSIMSWNGLLFNAMEYKIMAINY